MKGKRLTRFDVPQELKDELLRDGYSSLEYGYRQYSEDYILVAIYARMANCTSDMVKWWFTDGLTNTQSYKFWFPGHTAFAWDENKKPHQIYGATHLCKEMFNGSEYKANIYFCEPTDIFTPEELKNPNVKVVLCGEQRDDNGEPISIHMHIARDTYFGCEVRIRSLTTGTVDDARAMLMHGGHEWNGLAEFLPGLYRRENYLPCHNGEW